MIENSVSTMIRSAESIGGGLFPAELAQRTKRVKEAKESPRYCENPNCRVLKLTGEKQRLSAYNIVVTERGKRRSVQPSRVCSWCSESELEQLVQQHTAQEIVSDERERCVHDHVLAIVGQYANGECKACKAAANQRRREGIQIGRPSHRPGYIVLYNLNMLKKKWGGSYPALAREVQVNTTNLKSWAYLDCAAPPEVADRLAQVLGCTVADLMQAA